MAAIAFLRAYWKPAGMFILVLLACLTTHKCTSDHYKLQMERKDRAAAVAMVKASEKARKQEQKWSADFAAAANLNRKQANETIAHRDRLLSELRAGRLRVPSACPRMPQAAADSGQPPESEDSGQPGLDGEELVKRLAVCDEVVLERNQCAALMVLERR